ncbi:hypothetical protein OG429_39065 [Streptomyces sp. NBC_00190]|uniref:variant leucine-rich repeat-containing protein n=1 Tax=Streptomyces sp. NBC_00190 TaxID=2903634 RepID=UPI002E29DCF3|nr:hypothetical protein [Streptomyces sp. NBC_00190]
MDRDDDVAEAWSPATPLSRLRELAAQAPGTARIVASRIGQPADLAEEVAARAVAGGPAWFGVLCALAAHPATSAERLAELAAHPEESVRRVVAVHRATPKAALKALARDGSAAVRRALAGRERLPRKVAAVLVADTSAEVRLTLVRRIGARPEHLRSWPPTRTRGSAAWWPHSVMPVTRTSPTRTRGCAAPPSTSAQQENSRRCSIPWRRTRTPASGS